MRKMIVCNFGALDGYYEQVDKTIDAFFDYCHEDYAGAQSFDYHDIERLRAAGSTVARRFRSS